MSSRLESQTLLANPLLPLICCPNLHQVAFPSALFEVQKAEQANGNTTVPDSQQ